MFVMGEPSRPVPRATPPEVYRPWYWTQRWKRRRAAQLRAEPFCRFCLDLGVYAPATVADHVEPHHGDPVKFWEGALQSLCKLCHDRDKKLAEAGRPLVGVDADGWPNTALPALSRPFAERRFPSDLQPSAIPLTIVCGRPASGKSTYVEQHAQPGDVVIDLDAILTEVSGLPAHDPGAGRYLTPALEERNRRLRALHTAPGPGRAWFIVTAPDPGERARWARCLGGDVVVVDTPLTECIRRIRADPGRSGLVERMVEAARTWR